MTEEHVFPVSPEIAKSAWCDNDKYLAMYKRSIEDPEGFWGEHGKRIDWFKPYSQVKDVSLKAPDVHIRWFADGTLNVSAQLPRPPSRRPRRADGDPVGGRRPGRSPQAITYERAARAGLQVRQRAEVARRQEGRPGDDLSADDPGAADRHAGLRPDRRHPLHRLRRLLARSLGDRIQDCDCQRADHRRRGPARRPQGAAQGQRRRGAEVVPAASTR